MSGYCFELAGPGDDAAIRQLLARNGVPGQMVLTYEREPNYFLGCSVMGPVCQTLVARHEGSGAVAAMATRSVRPLYVNGRPENVGYIGQLRVDEAHRGRWVLPGGFSLFHKLHEDGLARGYVTTIIEGNAEAEGLLVTKARRHYPAYRKLGRLCTLALVLRRRFRRSSRCGPEIRKGSQIDLDDVVRFLAEEGACRQFFPVYKADDFRTEATRDFDIADLYVAFHGGRLAGVLGLWDQSRYKQTVVRAYGKRLQRARSVYNLGARAMAARALPDIGQSISAAYVSFVCVKDGDKKIFDALLRAAHERAADRGYAYLTLGLSESDPLLPVARRFLHIPYYSTIYTVCWPGDETFHDKLDGRPPYLELATL